MCRITKVENSLIQALCTLWPPRKFSRDFPLFYAGQIPNVSAVLVRGAVERQTQGKTETLEDHCLIGVNELLTEKPSSATVLIKKGALVSIIDRHSLEKQLKTNVSLKKQIAVFIE